MLRAQILLLLANVCLSITAPTGQQKALSPSDIDEGFSKPVTLDSGKRPLQGRFLHISGEGKPPVHHQGILLTLIDLHPDPFYKYHSSVEQEDACHRGRGPAGILGAETTDCDSPLSLINATFKWIDKNLKDRIDFVIWTGDSARHDNDEHIPRTDSKVEDLNRMMVDKFVEVFGKEDNINDTDPTNDFTIPIVPTWGNNDILPHNIFLPGPNKWTKKYLHIWRKFIPEAQRHSFERGGWFSVEVIPNKLAVFSLNTLYFFDSNSAVDGCADVLEPGYEQMEWLRIQLQFLRERGLKAIIMGHVPPARTESKTSWDETCWQKYTLWMHRYRDVVVGSVYGHMNIDHFMLQDSEDVDLLIVQGGEAQVRTAFEDEFTTQSAADYLTELRYDWSRLPEMKHSSLSDSGQDVANDGGKSPKQRSKRIKKSKEDKYLEEIGGRWGERYSLSLVSPSVVPNYYPTIRVVEYNITGLDDISISTATSTIKETSSDDGEETWTLEEHKSDNRARKFNVQPEVRKPKRPRLTIPSGPSKSSPPGPAYSPQTLSWLGYIEYYANLTVINNDFIHDTTVLAEDNSVESEGWKKGKHRDKKPKDKSPKPNPKEFRFEVEYNTRNDSIFQLKDLTVRSYIDLASRIGQYKPRKGDHLDDQSVCPISAVKQISSTEDLLSRDDKIETQNARTAHKKHKKDKDKKKKKQKKKKEKKRRRKAINRVWFTFVRRAFVGARTDEELHDTFGQPTNEGLDVDE